jgi:hypothetical protein
MEDKIQDSLKVTEAEDGFLVEWDPEDPSWSFLNSMTEEEINMLLQEKLDQKIKEWQNETCLE